MALFRELLSQEAEDEIEEVDSVFLTGEDDLVAVHFEAETELLWLTSWLAPVSPGAAPVLLPRLLLGNSLRLADDVACSFDAQSAAPIVQSWTGEPIASIGLFEAFLERHRAAVEDVRADLALMHAQEETELRAGHALWG